MNVSISDPLQLFAFGTAGLISAILILYQIYSRFMKNGIDKAVIFPAIAGALLAVFAGLSALHNKSGESLAWLYSSEAIDRGLFEWGTVLCLIGASYFAIIVALKARGLQRYVFLGLAVASFIVAGEELSWGQWVFRWNTPEVMAEINRQNETNIHNVVNPRIYDILYYIMGFTIIGLSTVAFFFFGKSNNTDSDLKNGLKGLLESGGKWLRGSNIGLVVTLSAATLLQHELLEEYAEFVLALTVMLFIIHHYQAIKKQSKSQPMSNFVT
ncbi:hypothetical protein [Robiginitomaculum antarcticum]|uniref:hypothetical protein n=1 Tax=Robiginitomaculum antarcticum TaxID=437507 RepID=UPI0003715081|nr:hypothetical protein [Robiginitomaculum antarcticum]